MKRVSVLLSVVLFACAVAAQSAPKATAPKTPASKAVGQTFAHDGVKLYYEVYGQGEPLLLIHGNGGSSRDFVRQIPYFRARYKIIAMDSRDQGRSGDSAEKITYEKMADDLAALLDHLKIGPVNVLGWSDGAIEALLLGIRHPEKVKKIAAMAANLDPEGATPEVVELVKQMMASAPPAEKQTAAEKRDLKATGMMLEEPHINPTALESITAPTLIMAGDHDVVRDEHTLEIYHHIPNSELAIFPNATHLVPFDEPALFNATVEKFFRTPFVKKDRIKDAISSLGKLREAEKK